MRFKKLLPERKINLLNEEYTKEEQGELILANTIEEIVKYTVNEIIENMDMCTCKICRLNACAIALNKLPPHYVTTTTGALLAKIPTEMINYHIIVLVEVTKALMAVKEHPMHK